MGVKVKNTNTTNYYNQQDSKSSQMGVLKKVKKRLGLSGRGAGSGNGSLGGPVNLPPLLFHQVHGDHIRVSYDGRTAKRTESFCKGITFSARPVKINERICIKFMEVSNNWNGVVRFGFTSNDPGGLRYSLPKYSCPDLTSKPGYWAKALSERLCEKDVVLHYFVTSAGDVYFGINGEEKGVFFSGVDTRSPLWALIDVYGNSTAVEFLDPRYYLNNRRLSNEQDIAESMNNLSLHPNSEPRTPPTQSTPPSSPYQSSPPVVQVPRPVMLPYTQEPVAAPHLPPKIQQSRQLLPLSLHRTTKGRNIRLSGDGRIASRRESEFCSGYVFLSRPSIVGEKIFLEICNSEPVFMGSLAVGVTSCDPSTLSPCDLPDDSVHLLDRPEYWSVAKDVGCTAGDTLAFSLTPGGELTIHHPNSPSPITLMHVDLSTTVWMFFDVYGTTQKVRLLGTLPPPSVSSPRGYAPLPPPPPTQVAQSPASPPPPPTPFTVTAATRGGGTVLVVNLPPTTTPPTVVSVDGHGCGGPTPSSDCSVCYERSVDSVLYTCGHMCMCYECAVQQWRGKGGGHCPLCRAVIRDVIRTFRS